jgi:hypothetical protein
VTPSTPAVPSLPLPLPLPFPLPTLPTPANPLPPVLPPILPANPAAPPSHPILDAIIKTVFGARAPASPMGLDPVFVGDLAAEVLDLHGKLNPPSGPRPK